MQSNRNNTNMIWMIVLVVLIALFSSVLISSLNNEKDTINNIDNKFIVSSTNTTNNITSTLWTDESSYLAPSNINYDIKLNNDIYSNYSYFKVPITQLHRESNLTATSINTWYNISWDLIVLNETTGSWFTLINNNETIQVSFDGVIRIQGCIHPYNDDSGNQAASLYTRILRNNDEARCLQTSQTKEFKSNGIDTFGFVGTVGVNVGDNITLQWQTSNTNLILVGNTVFDNPVSASINFEKISELEI